MKTFIKKILNIIFSILFYLFRIFKIKYNRVIFSSFSGKGYGENPKYICEELLKNKDKFDIIWSVKKHDFEMPSMIKQVKIYSLKWFYYMSTSKVWINDSRFPGFVKKRKGQFYIQTWHSSLRLKKIEKDVEADLPKSYVENAILDSKMIDLITCGSEFSRNTYANSFWYNGPIYMCGTPKFDIYFKNKNKEFKKKICDKYGIDINKKIILYAPTFRSNNKKYNGNIDFNQIINSNDFNDFIFIVRLHPEAQNDIEESTNVKNVTSYPNLQDLLIASDYLITDYSGCCFDTIFAKKKCILYVPDLEEYIKKERNLYFNYNDLPFTITKNMEELKNSILNFDNKDYTKSIERFSKSVGLCEKGDASKLIANKINEVIFNEKI